MLCRGGRAGRHSGSASTRPGCFRLWHGGEEDLAATDPLRQGWGLTYLADLLTHHARSERRDSSRCLIVGLRNTLWFTRLRRPLLPAPRSTAELPATVARGRASDRAVPHALDALNHACSTVWVDGGRGGSWGERWVEMVVQRGALIA